MKERERLESLGYRFEVREERVTEPASDADVYYRVVVRYDGAVLGTRSELRRERALERAFEFVQAHSRGDDPQSLRG